MTYYKSLLALLAILSPLSLAQCQNQPQTCNDATSMTFEPEKIAGIWYEVARNPAPVPNFVCTQLNVTLQDDNQVLNIANTYGDAPSFPWVNVTMTANVTIDGANNPYGYNFTYTLGTQSLPQLTYKLLYTDYTNYALICGYQNITNNATYFNILLTRDRMPTGDALNEYESDAAKNFTGFSNSSMSVITQTEYCYVFGKGGRTLPMVEIIFGFVAALLLSNF